MKLKHLSKLNIAALAVSAFWLIEYFGFGIAIFAKMWYTSPAIPFVGGVFALLPFAAEILNIFKFKRKWLDISVICASAAFAFAHFLVFLYIMSKLSYIIFAGVPYFITAGLALLTASFIFVFPRLNKLLKRIFAISISVIIAIICLVTLFNATPFYISGGATVFAVDDEYQIAFATSHRSVGSVTVNGKTYSDSENGGMNICKLHKISVPASELDKAKSYSISTQSIALNTAYVPAKGPKISKTYSFRPVDESDGWQIYNLSDTHECLPGPANAASYFGDRLDLLILNGDIINEVSSYYQISTIYKLAHRITKGGRPVIYTRGNHEAVGSLLADFGKYVGCADRGFYYTYKVGSLSLLILDTNNDMADDNKKVAPVINFDEVRAAQSEWIKGLGDWHEGYKYAFVVAHMAYPLKGYTRDGSHWSGWAKELIELTDGKAQLAICGHSHKTVINEPHDDDNTIAGFPVLRGSIRSNKYAEKEGISPFEFTGTAIEIKGGNVNIKFTNAKKAVLGEYNLVV